MRVEDYLSKEQPIYDILERYLERRKNKHSFVNYFTEEQIRNYDRETGLIGKIDNVALYVVEPKKTK